MSKLEIRKLNRVVKNIADVFSPPQNMPVSQWADKYRFMSAENSAESGPWKTSRTPYLKEIMDAFSDAKVRRIAVVASSQVGKSEMLLNMLGYAIASDPGPAMFVLPTLETAKDFSKRRIAPMIRDCPQLAKKVSDAKSRNSENTMLQKSYPGGMLTITGANSPASLASIPARYVFGDERDRWPFSAGSEGDPWSLVEARTKTFYNAKLVEVSTPTIKGASNIEYAYELGTQEKWSHRCPECGRYHEIVFEDIKFTYDTVKVHNKQNYRIKDCYWVCPTCGCIVREHQMKKQSAKWIAENPESYENGIRSFWISAFASPWEKWSNICLAFLNAKDDPEKLKVVYNTMLGKLWEERGDVESEESYLNRREMYDAEVPDKVLCLTCGIDTQDNRLEYEVVGFGRHKETWGIKKGVIMGKPNADEVWQRVDDILDHTYRFKDGRGIKISLAFIDSGGHYTQEVYQNCQQRMNKRLFAIKGKGGEGIPFTQLPKRVKIKRYDKKIGTCWLYTLGVDSGKEKIMSSLKVQEPGPNYCHFPINTECNYDESYFSGLLSERLVLKKSGGKTKWLWEKIPGHERNEALDCRNYALAAFNVLDPDMEALENRAKNIEEDKPKKERKPVAVRRNRRNKNYYEEEW